MKYDLLTIIAIVNGIINLTLLTVLSGFFKTFREIAKEKEELIKEQKNLSDLKTQFVERELALTDKQNKQLVSEKEHLQKQLTEVLKSGGFNVEHLLNTSFLENLTLEFTGKVEQLTEKLLNIQKSLGTDSQLLSSDYQYHLSLGNAFVVNKKWDKALFHLEKAVVFFIEDWNLYLTIAICYSNVRGGKGTNVKSIEAYTKAIIYIPDSYVDIRGKIYIYRGAMLKRLSKLDEAEADIIFGMKLVKSKHFKLDAIYNLACVYAMRNDRDKLFKILQDVNPPNVYMNKNIKRHMHDYFYNFSSDLKFRELINLQ